MRHLYTGTTEYLSVNVTATVSLSAQVVAFSFTLGGTYLTAAWIGSAGTTRTARLLVNAGNMPAVGTYTIYVRVTDSPEIPVFPAGEVTVH